MMPTGDPTRDEILDAFSVEPEADRATLEIYLSKYPEYAEDLIDLSRALSWIVPEEKDALSALLGAQQLAQTLSQMCDASAP